MLKLFLLIPFITLNVAATLGLIYFTLFIDPMWGFTASLVVVLILATALVIICEHEGE